MLKKLFGMKERKEEREEEERSPSERTAPQARAEIVQVGVLSGKGGCGKSTIAANLAYFLAAMARKNEGVLAVDFDVINATLTSVVVPTDFLVVDDGVSVLDYLVTEPSKLAVYRVEYPPERTPTIQVAGREDLGVPVKNLYVLPAKKAVPSYESNIAALIRLPRDDLVRSVQIFYSNLLRVAKSNNIKYVVMDFPPLRADTRKVVDGVFVALELIPSFIIVTPYDMSATHGLVSLVTQKYPFIKSKTLGVLVNMVDPGVESSEEFEKLKNYIERYFGIGKVHHIRKDWRWTAITLSVPLIMGATDEGAHLDFIRAVTRMGLVDVETVKKKLNIPEQKLK